MKEKTKQKLKKSAKPAIFALVWMICFILIGPKLAELEGKVFPGLYFLMMAVAYGVPAFAAYRAMQPWLEDDKK